MEEREPVESFSFEPYHDHYEKIRHDTRAVASWLRGLHRTEKFNTRILSHITGLSEADVRQYIYLNCGRIRTPPVYAAVAKVPEDWRTNEPWLSRMHETHTFTQMMIILKVSRDSLRKVFRDNGIKVRRYRPPVHPCYSREWINTRLMNGGTIQSLSRDAKVSSQTISRWLVELGFRQEPSWAASLKMILRRQPSIKNVRHRRYTDDVIVGFASGHKECVGFKPKDQVHHSGRYYYTQIAKGKYRVKRQCIVTPEYQEHYNMQYNPLSAHLAKDANQIEKLLARSVFLRANCNNSSFNGFLNHPEPRIRRSLEEFREHFAKFSLKQSQGRILSGASFWDYRMVLEYYFDAYSLKLFSKFWRAKANTVLLKIPTSKMTTTKLVRTMIKKSARPLNPMFWAALFRELGVKGRVLDLWPHTGSKLMACWLLGLEYVNTPSYLIDRAVERGLFDYLGMQQSSWDGEPVDVIMADKACRRGYTDHHFRFLDKAKHTILQCTDREADFIASKYKVKQRIPVTMSNRRTSLQVNKMEVLIL